MIRLSALGLMALLVLVACGSPEPNRGIARGTDPSPVAPTEVPAPDQTTTALVTTASPPPAPAPEPRTVTFTFTGDLLLHNRVNELAAQHASDEPDREYDYRPLLEPIRPLIEDVDWAICHLEVNLSADNTRLQPFPTFRSPGQIAYDVHDLGYDSCSVASNHILDHGVEGVTETLAVLDAAGLGSTGAARTSAEAVNQIWIDVGDIRVAHLSYSYGFNGFTVPTELPWLANIIDEAQILSDASRARADDADIVILSLHWGEQYVNQTNWQQRDIGPRLLASPDVDLIVGHHAHVVQPIEQLDGEWLVHGLGNLLANAAQPARRDELLVQVTMTERADGSFASMLRAVPLYVDRQALTVYPSSPEMRPPSVTPALAAELDASWARVQDVLRTGSGWASLELG